MYPFPAPHDTLCLSLTRSTQVIVFGLIFPTTFAVTENFKRRERCADVIAQMKASSVAIFWAHRDWGRGHAAGGAAASGTPVNPALPLPPPRSSALRLAASALPQPLPELDGHTRNVLEVLREFLANVRGYMISSDDDARRTDAHYARAMRSLSTLHVLNEVLGASAGYSKGCEGGISRIAQYTRYLLAELEQLRILRLYAGSPHGLRFFVALMAHVSPIFLAPYFRNFCSVTDRELRAHISTVTASAHDYGSQGSSTTRKHVINTWTAFDPCAAGFFAAALYCAVICTLYAVLCDIEDLCDGDGLDDLHFNLDVELDEASAIAPLPAAPSREPGGVPAVLFSFGDCLGPERTAGSAEFEEDRVFAHRDPTKRLSRPSQNLSDAGVSRRLSSGKVPFNAEPVANGL